MTTAVSELPLPPGEGWGEGLAARSTLTHPYPRETEFLSPISRQSLVVETPHSLAAAGERWPVSRARADQALARGCIEPDQHQKFLRDGTIGSHLENLERREGYKGFNQQAVSAIIAATDPRLH